MERLSEGRWITRLIWVACILILIALGGVVISHSEELYTPLTMDQAKTYIQTLSADDLAREIIKLDWIEHNRADFTMPDTLAAVRGRDVSIAWQGPIRVGVPPLPESAMIMPQYTYKIGRASCRERV